MVWFWPDKGLYNCPPYQAAWGTQLDMANWRTPGPICTTARGPLIDAGTLGRHASPTPGSLGMPKSRRVHYSYSISGTIGALGSMLFTEATRKLPGTWYDRTESTTKMRAAEAKLGQTEYFDEDAHKAARRTLANIRDPDPVDVDIHFVTKDRVENITVSGRLGKRTFKFDFDRARDKAEKLPKDADPFQPFLDTIEDILDAARDLR